MRNATRIFKGFSGHSWAWALMMAACLGLTAPQVRAAGVVTNMTELALRYALIGGGLVTFTNGGTITLTAPLTVANPTTILGPAGSEVILSGRGSNAILRVTTNLALGRLTLTGGVATNKGGAMWIQPTATVVATNCTFTANQAVGTNGIAGAAGKDTTGIGGDGKNGGHGTDALGGAIFNEGQLTLVACQFLTNTAVAGNGATGGAGGKGTFGGGSGGRGGNGGAAAGGAVCSTGWLVVSNCTFAGNSATAGDGAAGGVAGAGGTVALDGNGGAGGRSSGAALSCRTNATVVGCTFVGNHGLGGDSAAAGQRENTNGANGEAGGDAEGAGLWVGGICSVTNCTFAANDVTGGNGGNGGDGFLIGGDGGRGGYGAGGNVCNAGTLRLVNSTLVQGNSLSGFGGAGGDGPASGKTNSAPAPRGGNLANTAGTLLLKNSILAYPANGTNSHVTTNIVSTVTNYTYEFTVVSTNTFALVNSECGTLTFPYPSCYTNIVFTNGSTITSNVFFLTNSACLPPNGFPTNCLTNLVFTNLVTSNYSETIWVTNVVGMTNYEPGFNAYGAITDGGNNISSDDSPTFNNGSRNNTDPKLGSLADNGGPTKTIALLVGSPALNAGDDAASAPFDQRGRTRPAGVHCDIGAVEMGAPVIQTQPQSQATYSGDSVQFTVTATGDTTLFYQWRFDGTRIADATTTRYTLVSAQPADAGEYTVWVLNTYGALTSQVATLTVTTPLRITQPTLSDGTNLAFAYPTQAGLRYFVEYKDALTNVVWTRFSTNLGDGAMQMALVPLTNVPSRFFRVVEE